MIVFPTIDIESGLVACARHAAPGVIGNDPVAVARHWRDQGAEAIHLVDLDAGKAGGLVHVDVVERVVHETGLPVQYGGGVRDLEALATISAIGVRWVIIGTVAVTKLDLLPGAVEALGERLVVAVESSEGMVATQGWHDRSEMSATHFARLLAGQGVGRVLYTDESRDRMLGPDLRGLAELAEIPALELILSGGVSSLDDLRRLRRLAAPTVAGVVVGRALYEGSFSLAAATAVFAG